MTDINITYYPADDLVMAEYNPRQLTKDQYAQLKDSIMRFGLVDPLIVNKNKDRKNILVGGHQRLRIAKEMGVESIPCVEVDLTLDQEKELNIRLNKNVGEWDFDALANYFDVGELTEWGFSNDDLQFYEDEPKQGLIDDDEIPEVEEPIAQAGDLWILGKHRLLCGDATKKEDVDLLMDGQKADMVFTDPPYGIKHSGKGIKGDTKANDFGQIISDNDITVAVSVLNMCLKNYSDSTLIFWGANYYCQSIPNGYGWLVWDKEKEGNVFSGAELAFVNKGIRLDVFRHLWHGMVKGSEQGQKRVHPTQKPIALAEWCFNNYDNPDTILDLFLGSGSILIACEKTNRKCYGMEIDPHYCDVIVKRWEEFSGKKAERVERAEG
jgi:DNA modification methylase